GAVGREVIGQEPSVRCVLTRKAWARVMTGSLGLIPAWARAYNAWPVAQASLAMPFAWLQPPSAFCRSLMRRTSGCHSAAGRLSLVQRTRRIAMDCGSSSDFVSASHLTPLSRADLAEASPVAAAGKSARVARAVMLSSELPKIGGRVLGQEAHDPFSVWSPCM